MSGVAPGSEVAPIIVSALLASPEQAWLEGLRHAHFPPGRNHLAAHLTLFHHLPPSLAPELAVRLKDATRQSPPEARLAAIMNLGGGTAIRVEAPLLAAIRADLAEAFAAVLTSQDRAGWRPHVTIQNKVAPAQARQLQDTLGEGFAPRRSVIIALAAWWYRGGPWEPIARYPFRG